MPLNKALKEDPNPFLRQARTPDEGKPYMMPVHDHADEMPTQREYEARHPPFQPRRGATQEMDADAAKEFEEEQSLAKVIDLYQFLLRYRNLLCDRK